MALTHNACIAYRNLADLGTVTASSSTALTPAALLQNAHVARHWRSRSATEFVLVDLGAVQPVDTVALMGLSLTAAGLTRIRVSASDPSGQGATAYDSDPAGSAAGRVDPAYGYLVHLLPAPVAGRYVRIDLVQPGAPYIEAGRFFVGARHQFASNFAFGWNRAWVDRSRRTESRGGQTYIDPDNTYRTADLTFEAVREGERFGVVEEIDRTNGEHTDVLLVTDPSSPNLGRDSIWGLLTLSPVQQPAAWVAGRPIYQKSYQIKERL